MKLYFSPMSPFARKVRMTAHLCGLENQLQLVPVDVLNAPASYKTINPLIKLPALQMQDGQILVNSPFICEYLNNLSLGKKVLPFGPERWSILNDQAIADGGCDAAVLRRYESTRSPDKFDKKFDTRQRAKVLNAFEYFEQRVHLLSTDWTLREISVACMIGYVNFRFSNEKLADQFPKLFSWYGNSLKTLDFVKATAPQQN